MIGSAVTLLLVLILIAVLVLPAGAEVTLAPGVKRWRIIVAGIRMPIPYRLIEFIQRLLRVVFRKSKQAVKSGRFQSRLMEKLKALGEGPGTSPDKLDLADIKEAWRWLRWALRHVHIHIRHFETLIAFRDPALTGMAYGWACAVRSWLPADWPVGLDLDFARDRPEVSLRADLSARPIRILWAVFELMWKSRRRKLRRGPTYS